MNNGSVTIDEARSGPIILEAFLLELIEGIESIDKVLFNNILSSDLKNLEYTVSIDPNLYIGSLTTLFRYPLDRLRNIVQGSKYSKKAIDLLISSTNGNKFSFSRIFFFFNHIQKELEKNKLDKLRSDFKNIEFYINEVFQISSHESSQEKLTFFNGDLAYRSWQEILKLNEFIKIVRQKISSENFEETAFLDYGQLFTDWKDDVNLSKMIDNQYWENREHKQKKNIESLQDQINFIETKMHDKFSNELEEVKNFRKSAELILKDVEKLRADKAQSVYEESFDSQYVQSRKLVVDWDPKGKKKYLNSSLLFWGGAGMLLALTTLIYFFWQFHTITSNKEIQVVLARLSVFPLISILIWFCFHQYNRQKIIVEDYAHKKTVALSISTFIDQINNCSGLIQQDTFLREY